MWTRYIRQCQRLVSIYTFITVVCKIYSLIWRCTLWDVTRPQSFNWQFWRFDIFGWIMFYSIVTYRVCLALISFDFVWAIIFYCTRMYVKDMAYPTPIRKSCAVGLIVSCFASSVIRFTHITPNWQRHPLVWDFQYNKNQSEFAHNDNNSYICAGLCYRLSVLSGILSYWL